MPSQMQLSDLLPYFFETTVGRLTGENLVNIEREAIFEALLNSLRHSILRQVRIEQPFNMLETIDRFADEWLPRSEIIERIEYSSGLTKPLAHLALFMIEMRVDLNLFRSGDGQTEGVSIESLGTITSSRSLNWSYYQIYERLTEVSPSFPSNWWDAGWTWSSRSRNARERVNNMLELLEMSVALRPFLPYRISLSSQLVFNPSREHSRGQTVEWPQTDENTFIWRETPNA